MQHCTCRTKGWPSFGEQKERQGNSAPDALKKFYPFSTSAMRLSILCVYGRLNHPTGNSSAIQVLFILHHVQPTGLSKLIFLAAIMALNFLTFQLPHSAPSALKLSIQCFRFTRLGPRISAQLFCSYLWAQAFL